MRRIRLLPREYATFRKSVTKFLIDEVLPNTKTLLDPMCGTAPLIPYTEKMGIAAYFNDFLPVHYYINQAKSYRVFQAIKRRRRKRRDCLEIELNKCLAGLKNKRFIISGSWVNDDIMSEFLTAWKRTSRYSNGFDIFLKAAILLCIRPFAGFAGTTNYTWLMNSGMATHRPIEDIISEVVHRFDLHYTNWYGVDGDYSKGECHFYHEKAIDFRPARKIKTIITSPPFPNRTDYVIMYAPELYFLERAIGSTEIRELRKMAVGNVIVKDYPDPSADMANIEATSPRTADFLMEVKRKGPKRESNYYLRCLTKYFSSLFNLCDRYVSFLTPKGEMYMVVQNNVHRGEQICLDEFLEDYFSRKGLQVHRMQEWSRKHQGTRNLSKQYPLAVKKVRESIIRVQK